MTQPIISDDKNKPTKKNTFGMYINKKWYNVTKIIRTNQLIEIYNNDNIMIYQNIILLYNINTLL